MKRNPVVLVIVGIVVAVMLMFGVYEARHPRSSSMEAAPHIGQQAHDFTLQSLAGQTVHLTDFKGKAVLLNFWATWCEPCKIETPWLVELQKQYGPQGLQIVGVSMDSDEMTDVTTFVKKMGIDYPILVGKESETDAVGDAYGGIPFLPETFVINRDGKVVGKVLGLKSKSEIEDEIKLALASGSMVQAQTVAR